VTNGVLLQIGKKGTMLKLLITKSGATITLDQVHAHYLFFSYQQNMVTLA
jgi:hypothetical protein